MTTLEEIKTENDILKEMEKDNKEIADYRLKKGYDVKEVIIKVKDKDAFKEKHNISDEDAE